MSIRMRLTLWYSGILAIALLLFGIAVYVSISYLLYSNQKDQMEKLSDDVVAQIERQVVIINGLPQVALRLPKLDEFGYSGFYVQIVDREGNIADNNIRVPLPVPESLRGGNTPPSKPFYSSARIEPYPFSFLVYNVPIGIKGRYWGTVQIASIVNDIQETERNLRYTLILLAAVTVIITALLGWLLSRKALRPIELIIGAANQIQKDVDLDKRIAYAGPQDEVGRLTETINGMLGRIQKVYSDLEEAYSAQRRFVSDASHELRTPLTTIRGNVELLEKMWKQAQAEGRLPDPSRVELSLEAMRDIASEAERMTRLVSDLLSLARADAGHAMRKEPIELRPLVEDVARRAGFLPRTAEWQIGDLSSLNDAVVLGDADYLQQLLLIFIENAFKYTKDGFVRLDSAVEPGRVAIRITDTGIGIDPENVPHLFERFYRADPSRGETPGTGLGLAIAKWIVDEHGGTVEVLTQKGRGTAFVIWIPLHFPAQLD